MEKEIAARIKYIRDAGFPKVADRIVLQLGSHELVDYLSSLIVNPEEKHTREGFPPDVLDCILKIYNWYQADIPDSKAVW